MSKTLMQIDTVLTADSVEWCPLYSPRQLLALGTYQLDEKVGMRRGSLNIYSYQPTDATLSKVAQSKTSGVQNGILDMKWNQCSGEAYLALANSNGVVTFLKVRPTPDSTVVDVLGSTEVACSDEHLGLCLSLDWNKTSQSVIGVSDSQGQISLVEFSESRAGVLKQWKAHSFEAWIVAFGHEPSVLFSGGDDCKLYAWDTRLDCTKPSLVSKRHAMGVCSLQAHPVQSHLLASGSYDETLLLWDTRNMSEPLKDVQLGGGVWRVKWNKERPSLLATACMHNGFQLVNCHLDTSQSPEVVYHYNQHQSLAYGIDWCLTGSSDLCNQSSNDLSCQVTLATCSFYDHSMHVWSTCVNK